MGGGGGRSGGGGRDRQPSRPTPVDTRESAIRGAAPAAPSRPAPAPKSAPSRVAEKEYTIGPKRTRAGMTPAPVDARERAIAGETKPAPTVMVSSPEERARIKSYEEITKRGETDPTIGTAKVIGEATRAKMKTELLKGGTPVVERIGGKDVTVGVVGEGFFGEAAYTGRPGFDPIAARAAGEAPATKDEVTAEVTPEVTPEVVPDESVLGTAATTARERRRTRTRRAGQAGTILEGFGALYK